MSILKVRKIITIIFFIILFTSDVSATPNDLNNRNSVNNMVEYMSIVSNINENTSRSTIIPYAKVISDGINLNSQTTILTNNSTINKVLALSLTKVGCKYNQARRESSNIYDCSSFVRRMYQEITGVYIGLNTYEISDKLRKYEISFSELQPGDLVWRDGHIAMYLGGKNEDIIHAKGVSYGVIVESIHENVFTKAFRPINYIETIQQKQNNTLMANK